MANIVSTNIEQGSAAMNNDGYRFKAVTMGILINDMRFNKGTPSLTTLSNDLDPSGVNIRDSIPWRAPTHRLCSSKPTCIREGVAQRFLISSLLRSLVRRPEDV